MKRCPECRRDYYDDTLLYCLDDGNALLEGPASVDEPATAILHAVVAPGEAATRGQIHTTDQTVILPLGISEPTKRSFDKRLVVAPIVVVIVALGTYLGYRYVPLDRAKNGETSIADAKITRLTTSGKASSVAISPDGKYVVHVQDDGGQQSLYMRQVATQSNVQIVAPSTRRLGPLHFSPDGNYIYYRVFGQEFTRNALFQVPTLGGAPKMIVENLSGHISFSPDGRRFVFARIVTETESALIIVNADGTNEEKLIGSNATERFDNVAWSPDGEKIVYQVAENRPDSPGSTLFEVQLADRSTRPLTSQKWLGMQGLIWMSDGTRLLMLAGSQRAVFQIFEISYPDGTARRLTNDLDSYTALGLTADSATLAAVKRVSEANIWIAPAGDESRARLLTPGSGKVDDNPSWSHDGSRIVFSSQTGASIEIWSVNEDGTDLRQIISNAESNFHPSVSPDGRSIAFVSSRNGYHIWRANIDGGDARQITTGESSQYAPTFSLDGRWLFYVDVSRWPSVWKISAEGGAAPVRISNKRSSFPAVSPDGKFVAYTYKEDDKAPYRLAIASIDGGEPLKTFPASDTGKGPLRWTSDGLAVVLIETSANGVNNLVAVPISGGAPKQVTDFKSDLIFGYEYSRDGKRLALSRGTIASDVLLYAGLK
jgi:Tol biopolymer transport system component